LLFAKKKKNKKNNSHQQQQQSGFAWASSFKLKPFEAKATRELTVTALSSFQGHTGKPLLDVGTTSDIPKFIWEAPIAILIVSESTGNGNVNVNNDGDDDDGDDDDNVPEATTTNNNSGVVIVKYANKAALETLGLQPDEYERLLTGTDGTPPSRASTSSSGKDVVAINLPTVMNGDKQFQNKYTKKIVKGKDKDDITIVEGQRWAIERSSFLGGKFVSTTMGIAYTWNEWWIGGGDSRIVASPGGGRREYVEIETTSSLKEKIEEQGAAIRQLKEGEQGLGNKDPQVVSAVEELLRLKSLLASTILKEQSK
jgi:hypothetical protein